MQYIFLFQNDIMKGTKYLPEIQAVIKQAMFPAIMALIMTFERSPRREGAIAPKAPS